MAGTILFVVLLIVQGVFSCGKPPSDRNLIQEGLDGDIILALPAQPHTGPMQWEIQAAYSNQRNLTSHFALEEEGSFTYLLVSRALHLSQGSRGQMRIAIRLLCKTNLKREVYIIYARVISKKFLRKIVLQVPENSTIGTVVYKNVHALKDKARLFQRVATKDKSMDASKFFYIDSQTGAISVDSQLDYESAFKLLKMITVQRNMDNSTKIIIFWIKVTNTNDNQPEIFLRECFIDEICNSKTFVIEASQNGQQFIHNVSTLGANDKDGDKITFSIAEVKPKRFKSFCLINRNTGAIYMRKIESLPANAEIYLTVEATDGKFVDTVGITIKVKGGDTSSSLEGNGRPNVNFIDNDHIESIIQQAPVELGELPMWFRDEGDNNDNNIVIHTSRDPTSRTPDTSTSSSTSNTNERHLKQIRDQCSASVFVSKLSFSELASLLNKANITIVEEFCDIIQMNKGNSTSASNYGEILDELLTICDKMPREVLSLVGFVENMNNETDLAEYCLNSTSLQWFNGTVTMKTMSKESIESIVERSLSSRMSWCLNTTVILFLVTWALAYHY